MKNKREIIESKYPPRNNEDIWLKDLLLYASTTKGWLPLGSEKTYSNKTELLKDTPTGGTIGIDKETGTAYLYNDVSKEWTPIGGGGGITEVTYSELRSKRDAGKLTPGALYRITDYQCTTTQENTKSAGHQFDIVLLALSENKLAEEGWAMEHPTDVYDVTFADGVTKKCYIYHTMDEYNNSIINVVDIETKLGLHCGYIEGDSGNLVTIDENAKTASTEEYDSIDLTEENLTYNYFQNSNLSAWKVWYCLDNDKDRFAWADDSLDEDIPESIITSTNDFSFYRDASQDIGDLYAWASEYTSTLYTENEIPSIGDPVFDSDGEPYKNGEVTLYTPAHEGTGLPNGRGVIYRLIDEWNNDVPYDFKNIQLYLPIVDGEYVSDGVNTWVYTFCLYNDDEGTYEDGSLKIIEVSVDDTYIVFNNIFMTANFDVSGHYSIAFNVTLGYYSLSNEDGYTPSNCIYNNCVFATSIKRNTYLYNCRVKDFIAQTTGIYCMTKKVLTEE